MTIIKTVCQHCNRVTVVPAETIAAAARSELERLESIHRTEIADMAERFRSVNIERVMEQLSSSLPLPQDVINLVIAAREFWEQAMDESEESAALDVALEVFSSRVPYENEPAAKLEDQP